jgi:menaquinone-9 beta-reductase
MNRPPEAGGASSRTLQADVLVVGGGPAGTTVATLLARRGHAVLLCDAARFPRHKICGEYVPPAAGPIFQRLGVLEEVERLRPRRHVGMAVVAPGGTRVLGRYGGAEGRGWSLRRYDLDRALLDNARAAGAVVLQGRRVVDLRRAGDGAEGGAERDDGGWEVTLAGAEPGEPGLLRARALVGADGRNSLVARRLGLWRREPRHRRWAVMGHFRGVDHPPDHGEMIVTPYGYCGINPLPGDLVNVCIVVDPRRPGAVPPGRPALAAFLRERLESHPLTRRRMARAVLADGVWATGPIACRAVRPVAAAALLVGDAAGFFDPFTGEGIAMALRGGEMAAAVLDAALLRGDLSRRALAPYAAARHAAFAARLRLDRGLQRLLPHPGLTEWVAAKLRRVPDLADLLARITGDTAAASELLHPRVLARFLLA